MSYILDALKRAEAERERGAVPGLHTRHALPLLPQPGRGGKPFIVGAGAAALVLGALGAGLWLWRTPAVPVRLAAVEPAVAASPAGPLAQAVPQAVSPPAPVPAPAPKSVPASPSSAAPPAVAAPRAAATATPRPLPGARASSAASASAALPVPNPSHPPNVAPAQAAPAVPTHAPLLGELPEALRRQIPPLAISGSVYSENRAQRMLVVNNLVLFEGAVAAPEVNLEEIRAKSSVFSFRGTRFRVAH